MDRSCDVRLIKVVYLAGRMKERRKKKAIISFFYLLYDMDVRTFLCVAGNKGGEVENWIRRRRVISITIYRYIMNKRERERIYIYI